MSIFGNIISLFDESGNWPYPYWKNGYDVTTYDIEHGWDIVQDVQTIIMNHEDEYIHAILIATPCTCFTVSGAQYWPKHDSTSWEEPFSSMTDYHIAMALCGLYIVERLKPKYWALENPVGRLPKLIPELGKPRLIFNPCDYGDPYTKRTCLWGNFNIPKKNPIEPLYVIAKNGDRYSPIHWRTGGSTKRTKKLRSVTPMGFANAFYESNN